MDDYSNLSDEELQRIVDSNGEYDPLAADGGSAASAPPDATPDFSQMSDDDLKRIVDSDGEWMPEQTAPQQPQSPSGDGYGFMDRQSDQITAEGGRDAYAGQAVLEGTTPLTRSIRQGVERDEDKALGAWLSDGEDNTLRVALSKHGLERDPSLKDYKAKETGGFWEGFSDDLSRSLAQLPLGAGWLFRKAREADNPQKYATDHLMQSAFLSGFSRADIEQAKEVSQGDPAKMYDFFAERAESKLKGFAEKKQSAQARLAEHREDESLASKVAGGALGMIPMIEEFALGGAAGKAVTGATKLGRIAKTLPMNTWRGRVAAGLIHGVGTTAVLGPEMARRRFNELTADEYQADENGELQKIEGDSAGRALPKAVLGGLGEAAIFSMPIGEAAFGWATPMITKALRTKVGNTIANMYTNYVKYGQMTGLRGQPQMLALMDLNAFKDEVMGLGKKDADYEGFDEEWKKFTYGEDLPDGTHVPGTLSLKGQADLFISALGVMALQGGAAGVNAWRHGRTQKASYDRLLRGAFDIPQEQLDKMEPELKKMLVRMGDKLYSGEDAFGRNKVRMEQGRMHGKRPGAFEERLRRWCDKVGAKLGKASGEVYDEAGKYALQFDNSFGWEKEADTATIGGITSRFKIPQTTQLEEGEDGKVRQTHGIPWVDQDVDIGDGRVVRGQAFIDPNTGISVLKYLQTDAKGGDNGYVYLITDENGHRATRFGTRDAMDAARAMDVVNQRNASQRNAKAEAMARIRDSIPAFKGTDFVLAKDGAEFDGVLSEIEGRPVETGAGARGVTLPDGRVMLCLDRIANPQQMKDTMLHEVGRHKGIDAALPEPADKMGFLAGLARSGDPMIQAQLNRIVEARRAKGERVFGKPIESAEDLFKTDKDGNYDPNAANALEEVFAHMFDRGDAPEEAGWWDAHMNAIRGNLRKVFHGMSYNRAEAEEMYRGAMEKLAEQTGGKISYEPEATERERMVQEAEARKKSQRAGHEAERDVADLRETLAEEERAGAQVEAERRGNEELAERVQEDVREEERLDRADPFLVEQMEKDRKEQVERRIAREQAAAKQRKAAAQANEAARQQAAQDRFNEELERREERKRQGYEAARQEEAEAEAAAQERGKQAQEREEQKRAGYESADEQARLDRKNAIKTAFREGDARQAEEYDRAEAERKAREAAEEAAPLPDITVVDAELQGKGRTAPQNDVVRVNYGAEDGREGHQIVARRVTDDNGRVIGWDVNAVAKDGTETLIASTTKPKKDGEAAIRAVRRQIHEHFGLPYGRAQKEAMEAERRRVEESETRKEPVDETRNVRDEEPAQPEPEVRDELPAEGEEPRPADEGSAEAQGGEPIVVHHANEGREGDGVEAANDFLAGMFEDATTETPVEAPVAAPREEGAITPPRAAEGAEGGKSASGGDSSGFDFAAFDRINANRDPSTQFFDVNEELSPERRDENWRLVQGIAAMYDQKRIRGFYDFAKYMQRVNPAWYAEQKDGLRRLWNYAAETTGLFDRVGDYEARDAIRSVDEGRNVRDISAINALEAALQDIDVEMYPAAQLDRSDARVPNTKLAADPKSGIVPGNELKGRPRGLLSKPILGVEFEDGTVSVGTGRHRAELYARYGMDIPMRRVREADGWVTKKPDGSYDFTKIRLLDALDNIQDSKGTIEDYVAFFGDVKIPRAAAESEGFLGSKEARLAYALANDAHPDIRAAVNFEGGKVEGTVKPEQAAAIAEIAPIGGAPENDGLQHHLLKAALKDHTLDKRDLQIKASEALQMLRAKRNRDGMEQLGFDFFGNEDVQSAAERAEKYRAEKAAEYSRLAKSFREVQRAKEGDLVKKKITRDDLRALGINERKIAAGGKERQDELQRAIDKAVLEKMRWESINLDPDLRAQMEKDLGIAPTEPDFALESVTADQLKKEAAAQAQRDAVKKGLEAPLKGDGQVNVQPEMDLGQTGQQDLFSPIAETPAQSSAKVDFKRGDHVFLKGAAENQSITFLKANADGTADVQVKTPGANRYMPNKVETRSVPLGDISSTGMKDVLTEAERKRLAEGMASQRFFDAAEELTPERNKDYADWLKKYRMADTPDHRREWARKNPDRTTPEAMERAAFESRQYTPAKYKVPGAVKSRTLLEEPPALRATEPPDNDYKLHIPESIIRNGDLQEHQAEFVGYAGKAHETVRPDGTRLGMMGGYGTGAGKSRMIAGIILDNRNQGRKRALWITTQSGLIDDVRSESRPFGMDGMVSDIFGGKGVSVPKDGIGFGTYHGLRQDGIVEKIAQQLGKDFDGVIAFDEIHRAKTEGGRTQDAVVKLQELLPKARVVYMSATGATDVGNLGYAQRLGLWGEGTAFKDFEDFKKKVEGKGVSAMEMVAQTLKRRGQYLSANLSKEGVEFDHVAVPTTDAQKRTYAEYNGALKDVYKGVYDALEALGRLDYTVPPSSLHGMQQRLHYSMVTALKLPVLIERAKQELAKGNVPVFSLVNTNEAGSTREVAKALEEGRRLGMDEVNFGPKQILLDFLTKEGDKTYNKQEGAYRDYQFPTMKPVKDQSGEVVGFERDPVADGIRRRLVREVEALPDDFGNPINMIIDAFGKDNVANLTGLNKGGMAEDYKAFQDGGKKVLVFSGVANTGYTFSSDRKYKNQARRVLFPLQLGYRADELEQTLGRVHRNNQANAPIYVASTTDLPGERRFYSSVERRRGQMKALTTGDRAAGGNGITSEGDNFETKYAQDAVDGIIAALHRMGKLDEIAREMNFIKRTQRADGSVVEVNGMLKRDKSGAILPNVPAKRFLNRLLMLDPKRQDAMFSAFKSLLDQNVRWAKDDGEYDIGLQDIGSTRNDAVRSVKLADDMEVGHVNSWFKTDKVPFDDFARDHAAEFLTYVRNKRTGETFAVRADGKMGRKQEPAAMRYAVDGTKKRMRASILDTEKPNSAYERLDAARAKELWDAEYGVIPDERADDGFYAHGDLLRHWTDVLGSKPPRTFRVKAGDAPEYIGAKIDADEIPAIFGRFGKAEEARDMVIDGKVREVLNNRTVDLVNGWTLKQVPRDGAKAVMVRGVEPGQLDAVAKELGGEVSKKRIFMKPDAAKLRKIIEEHPANLYRDDEKIGDTGNLRFFNREEEADRDKERMRAEYSFVPERLNESLQRISFDNETAADIAALRKTAERNIKAGADDTPSESEARSLRERINKANANARARKKLAEETSFEDIKKRYLNDEKYYREEAKELREELKRLEKEGIGDDREEVDWYTNGDLLEILDSIESGEASASMHFDPYAIGPGEAGPFAEALKNLADSGNFKGKDLERLNRLAKKINDAYKGIERDIEDPRGPFGESLRYFDKGEESTDEGRLRGKTYGVPYQGSKNRIADRLVAALPSGRRFVDLFSGGGAVTHAAMESGKYGTYRMNDLDGTGQDLFLEGVRGKWDGYSRKTMTPEEFAAIKGTPEALAWSFNGLGRNLARAEAGGRDRAAEQIRRIQSLSSLRDKAGKVVASKTDYRNVKLHKGDVVYADIPYEATDTRGYRKGMEFDKAAFVEWAQKQDVPVFVSEYTMPEGWTELRSFAVPGMRGGERAEKLFVQSKFADRDGSESLRFMDATEEAGDREREEMRRRWMEGTQGIKIGDERKFPGVFGSEDAVRKAKAAYDALPKIEELPSKADLTDEEADMAFRRHVDSIRAREAAVKEWAETAPDTMPFADTERDSVALVSKDTKEPGKWRTSYFSKHNDGLVITGHSAFDTKAKAVEDAMSFGREYDPSVRFFDTREEADRDRDAAYRDWLKRYGMDDTEKHRAEWERKHPAMKATERRISPADDAAYMDAVNRGDTETAQRIADEVAKRAGYSHVAYHGTPFGGWNEYDLSRGGMESGNGRGVISLTSSRPEAEAYSRGDSAADVSDVMFKVNKVLSKIPENAWKATEGIGMDGERFSFDSAAFSDYAEEFTRRPDEFDFDSPAEYKKAERKAEREGYLAAMKSVLSDMKGVMPEHGAVIDEAIKTLDGASPQNPEVKKLYVRMENAFKADASPRTYGSVAAEAEQRIREGKNDGAIIRLEDGTLRYFVKDPAQIKSADAITRDNSGNVIPLSQRFNRQNPDIRFFNIDEEAGRRVHAKDYDEALRMEGAGAGRREIWEKTGWWKAKDGKWRYEIPGISQADTQSMLDAVFTSGKFRDKNKANVYTFTLNDLEKELKDKGESLPTSVKTLLKAYPKLGKESIEVDRAAEQPKDGTLGYATKGTIHLYERGTTAETLNHELQHRIQAASGMAGGTNTDGKSFDRYTHEHGEWEARQAATRADMTAEQRDSTAPWETADRHGVAEDATLIDDANRARIRPDGEPPEPEPAAPAMDRKTGIGEKAKTELMDRYDPIKKMEIETGRRGKKDLFVEKSPYNAMRQLHGHNEAARQRYEKIWKRPFEEMLRKSGVGLDDVGMYMLAMNAKDRNRKVLNRTGALDGAGMSDADADKALADLRSFLGADKMRKIEDMANFLWKMQKEGMERRVESGRVSRETADLWEQEEPHHVPMRDDLSDEDGDYNRSTRRWTRNDFHEAGGRYTLPDNPVEFMFKEYQDAMYGSNINDARRALADFVRSTPGVGKIRRGVRRGKAWSFTHGQIEDFPDPNYREQSVRGGAGRPNLVSFKEGGDLYMIELNGKQGERVAEAVIGRGVVNMWKPVAAFTRGYASTATEYSVAFLGRNFAADILEASLNTMADKGLIRGGFSAVKNIMNAVRMAGTIRKYIRTGKFEGAFADTMRRYVESGAMIGGMGNEGYTELKNDLGKVASGKYGVMDVLKFVGRTISEINKQGELATRLAVFKDYIDGGASDGEAAMRSREYSTDFNKYGNQRWMNSAWMFSGSVIGGAVRQTASLVQGKAGKQLMLGLFTYGIMEAVAEHFFNEDEDEKAKKSGGASGATMTEYNRANSLYFRMGDKFIRVPFHAGPFSVLKYAGNLAARAALGDISGAEAAKHIAKEAFDSGMHFTGTGDFNSDTPVQSILPTLLVPFYQLKGNEDYAGRPIRRQMFSETKPYSENGRKQTGDTWKSMARTMNAISGGNERRRGWFDFSPENYKFVVDSALKNLGRDITTVSDFVTDLREGKPIDSTHVLFGRDYYRDVPDNTQNFYEAEKAYKADRADGTIKQGSRRDEAVKKLLRDIMTLRHWEDGEEKVGSRWVKRRNPSEATKEKHKRMRLKYQQRVIELMRRKK